MTARPLLRVELSRGELLKGGGMCFDYDDGPGEMYEQRAVTCRKAHRCAGCRRVIEAGQKASFESGKYDVAFWRRYTCEACQCLVTSIAMHEIKRGCAWHQAWCAIDELGEYLSHSEPITLLQGSPDECRQQVNTEWEARRSAARVESLS